MEYLNRNKSWINSIFIKIISCVFWFLMIFSGKMKAQNELNVINNWLYFKDSPNALYNHLAGQAFDLLENRTAVTKHLHTLDQWEQRQKWVGETLLDIVGPFPEKTSLNAQLLRTIEKDDYRIEHILFESQPGFFVTSSLFIPKGLMKKSPMSAIIYCSGHSTTGYRTNSSQQIILNLVKKGFIVFAFDPVGQGERLEYFDPETGKSIIGGSTREHSYPGTQAFITGSSQARYMIWDGIRAVDYLFTRKEIDATRIGITGGSGGGTQSALIAAMDTRIYAAAPERYITNYTRLLQSIGPTDAEQSLFNAISRGIDHADFLIVRAPKPTLMITTTMDFFSIQGARETANEVAEIYKAYNKTENFGKVEDDAPHMSTKKNREAMYAFFQKHLNNPGNSDDEEIQTLNSEEMKVTGTGQVSTSLKGETVFSLNRLESEKLVNKLKLSRNNLTKHLPEVLSSAKKLSGYNESTVFNEPVFTGRIQRKTYVIEKYFVKGEGDYAIPYLLMVPNTSNNKAIIYLHPSGKLAEASADGEIEWFVNNGFTILAPDMLGIGETGPGHFSGSAVFDSININIWYGSMLIGRSIVGIRAGDVVRLTELLKKENNITDIYGFAKQEMCPILLYAAAFNQDIKRIALIEPYASYRFIVMNHFYNPRFIYGAVPGALEFYDLPDLAASLSPRKLLMVNITDGLGKATDTTSPGEDIEIINKAYNNNGQLNIISGESTEKPYAIYMEWMK